MHHALAIRQATSASAGRRSAMRSDSAKHPAGRGAVGCGGCPAVPRAGTARARAQREVAGGAQAAKVPARRRAIALQHAPARPVGQAAGAEAVDSRAGGALAGENTADDPAIGTGANRTVSGGAAACPRAWVGIATRPQPHEDAGALSGLDDRTGSICPAACADLRCGTFRAQQRRGEQQGGDPLVCAHEPPSYGQFPQQTHATNGSMSNPVTVPLPSMSSRQT